MSKLWKDSFQIRKSPKVKTFKGDETSGCKSKKRFNLSEAEAIAAFNGQQVYKCGFCGEHHLTSKRAK